MARHESGNDYQNTSIKLVVLFKQKKRPKGAFLIFNYVVTCVSCLLLLALRLHMREQDNVFDSRAVSE